MEKPFWKRKKLHEMNEEEWESLCDGCARCCLQKVESEKTDEVHYSRLACRLLNLSTCRCKDYLRRHNRIPECVTLTPERVSEFRFLPPTCAYRLLSENKPLPSWHPLCSGSRQSVHLGGMSVRAFAKRSKRGDLLEHNLIDLGGEQ